MSKRRRPSIGESAARRFAAAQGGPVPLGDRDLVATLVDLVAELVSQNRQLLGRRNILEGLEDLRESAAAPRARRFR